MTSTEKSEYLSNEANQISDKMKQISIDNTNWRIVFLDESTGAHWLMDYLHPERHGGGIPRLRLMDEVMMAEFLEVP